MSSTSGQVRSSVEADLDLEDVDPRFPAHEAAHVVGDHAGGRRVGGGEHEVVDPAAELGAHRPLAGRRAEHSRIASSISRSLARTSAMLPVASARMGTPPTLTEKSTVLHRFTAPSS